jgi:hypothetical protein
MEDQQNGNPPADMNANAQLGGLLPPADGHDVEDHDMEDADGNGDLVAVNAAMKTMKPARYDGTGDIVVWLAALLFQLSLFVPVLTDRQVSIAIIACLAGKAAHAALGKFGADALRKGDVGVEALKAWLHAAFGRTKPATDMSIRHELQTTTPKRKNGVVDYLGHVQWFQQRLSLCPNKPDDITLIFWLQQQLPNTIQQLLHTDPATNQPYVSFALYVNAVTNHLAVLAAAVDKSNPKDAATPKEGGKRKGNGHFNGSDNKKPRPAHANKSGYVPDLSKEERERCIKQGLCFKCKQPGHVTAKCKNQPK